jgi:hypothetical protein
MNILHKKKKKKKKKMFFFYFKIFFYYIKSEKKKLEWFKVELFLEKSGGGKGFTKQNYCNSCLLSSCNSCLNSSENDPSNQLIQLQVTAPTLFKVKNERKKDRIKTIYKETINYLLLF